MPQNRALHFRHRRAGFWGEIAMVAPATLLVTVFVLIPIIAALYLSFTDWDGFSDSPNLVGVANYLRILGDHDVLNAAGLTGVIALVGTVACNVLGLGFALLISRSTRFNAFVRAVLFYPYIVGAIIIGFLWSAILGSNGAVNSLLESLSTGKLPFLSDPLWAAASVIFVIVWSQFGVNLVLFVAGLQTIPDSMIEAATIDGASAWQTFWRVKLPFLAPVLTINIVLVVIGLLRTYEIVLALTAGGPAGRTETIAFHILSTSFRSTQLGYGAAQSIVLMVVIALVTVSITSFRRRADRDAAA